MELHSMALHSMALHSLTLVAFTAFDFPTLKRPPPGPPPIDAPMPRERIRKKPMINNVGANRPTSDMIEGWTMNCTGR